MTSLINNPLFSGISAEVLSDNLKDVNYHTKVYRKGDILARQGDICNRLVILTKGSVRGEMIDDSGRLIKVEDITAQELSLRFSFLETKTVIRSKSRPTKQPK